MKQVKQELLEEILMFDYQIMTVTDIVETLKEESDIDLDIETARTIWHIMQESRFPGTFIGIEELYKDGYTTLHLLNNGEDALLVATKLEDLTSLIKDYI